MSAIERAELAGDYKYIETCRIYKSLSNGDITKDEAISNLSLVIGSKAAINTVSLWNKGLNK